eukprot:CAMPEP_0194123336 /NCGR_PEP_ID=MMETSP0150-20130528/54078_1 /TAXON_ID=122233 /ORGANISM="Chaetoceros debilis, Strain MM31A-1" /LENGTH=114 /DNA_ID=CAMNT_0038816539 /DNA_START=33 /DNA_END=373 /DNA_ORIENTATION=+
MTTPINVVVVEAHNHALEHVHYILRRRSRSTREFPNKLSSFWTMVHFDSHPDLACPNGDISAAACFQPRREWQIAQKEAQNDDDDEENNSKNLYELLDTSQGGIAEWIIPLVMA